MLDFFNILLDISQLSFKIPILTKAVQAMGEWLNYQANDNWEVLIFKAGSVYRFRNVASLPTNREWK